MKILWWAFVIFGLLAIPFGLALLITPLLPDEDYDRKVKEEDDVN